MILADITFGHLLLTVLEVFIFAAWLMILFTIIGDLFRDQAMSGWGKAGWTLFLIFVPFLAAFIYLITRGDGMRERAVQAQEELVSAAGGGSAADELAKLADLHDSGKISDAEFEAAKAKIIG